MTERIDRGETATADESPSATPRAGLSEKASRGAAITMVGQLTRVAVQTVGVVVMARILTPSDFGVVAMATAIAGAGEVIRDFGLGMAAVQSPNLTRRQRSNLFWWNSGLGLAVTVVVFAASWPIAALYDDSRVVAITQALSITFLLNGMGSQYRAHLQRRLSFTWLAFCEVMSLGVGVSVGIYAGLSGAGYWAIVWQQLAQATTGLLIVVLASRWLPSRYSRGEPMSDLLRFGWNIMGYQLVTYTSKNVDSIAIGAQFGAGSLGFYNRAFQLLTVPLNQLASPLVRVAVAVLSRIQDDRVRFQNYLATAQAALMFVMLSILVGLCAVADPFVRLLLGPSWGDTVPLFQILSIAGIFQIASYPALWAFISLGLAKENLRYSLVARPILIVLVIIGSLFSVTGVAFAYAAGTAISWPLALWWLHRSSSVDVKPLATQALRTICVFAVGGLVASQTIPHLWTDGAFVACAVGVVLMLAVVAVTAVVWPRFRADAALATRALRQIGTIRRASNRPPRT